MLSSGSNAMGQVWSGEMVIVAPTNATMPSTAAREATSPAACPPMPSATTNNLRSSRTETLSSLVDRRRPLSVAQAEETRMGSCHGRAVMR